MPRHVVRRRDHQSSHHSTFFGRADHFSPNSITGGCDQSIEHVLLLEVLCVPIARRVAEYVVGSGNVLAVWAPSLRHDPQIPGGSNELRHAASRASERARARSDHGSCRSDSDHTDPRFPKAHSTRRRKAHPYRLKVNCTIRQIAHVRPGWPKD